MSKAKSKKKSASAFSDEPSPVGIWIRVSTADQAMGNSPTVHRERALQFCKLKGWEVKEVYDLAGVSGKTVWDHPEAKRMRKDIQSGKIKKLVFTKLARLARNTQELLQFADYFEDHSASLVAIEESIDTGSPAGKLFYTVIAAVAAWEREETVARINAGILGRAKLGLPVSGRAPYGFKLVDKRLVHDEKEKSRRIQFYNWFKAEKRVKTVVDLANDAGWRTRTGGKFTDTTMRRYIEEESAKGVYINNKTRRTEDGSTELKPPEEWLYHTVEPLISDALWEACNAILAENKRSFKQRGRKAVNLFGNAAYCHCGGKMYVESRTTKYVCKLCRHKIEAVDLEKKFVETLREFQFGATELSESLANADEQLQLKETRLRHMETQVETLEERIDQLFELHYQKKIDSDEFEERSAPFKEQLKQSKESLAELQAEVDLDRSISKSEHAVVDGIDSLHDVWDTLESDTRSFIVDTLVKRVVVRENDIEVVIQTGSDPA